jgi:alpha/beta superfamily hydrolase
MDDIILTGDLSRPDEASTATLVVCHPHPLYGGDRNNAVVRALIRAAERARCASVAFDFRGAGESMGEHDGNGAERLDVAAALAFVSTIEPELPVILAGYSFGAATALTLVDERVAAWIAIAPPISMLPTAPIAAHSHRPKFIAMPEHDQFTTLDAIRDATQSWDNTIVRSIDGADHFLVGQFVTERESVLDEFLRLAIASTL